MVIFITGDRNIGKTTIINNIVSEFSSLCCGIITEEFLEKNIRTGFIIRGIGDISSKNLIATMDQDFKPIVYNDTFETIGVNLCKQALQSNCPIVLIDEIGVFENNATLFKHEIENILSSGKIVVGVLKDKPSEFISSLKSKFGYFTITKSNRNQISHSIITKIKRSL